MCSLVPPRHRHVGIHRFRRLLVIRFGALVPSVETVRREDLL
jgi:hypothetical protein